MAGPPFIRTLLTLSLDNSVRAILAQQIGYLMARIFNLTKTISISLSAATILLAGCATNPTNPYGHSDINTAKTAQGQQNGTLSENELVDGISKHLGVTSESAASVIARLFRERGTPVGYITGEEGGGALGIGVRYGKGTLWMKDGSRQEIYWQGPTVGFDAGADASKVFTLVYGLNDPNYLFQRFPGVDGSAYLVAGMAVNYQRANGITLAPIRSGVGARLGANVGYTSYTRKRSLIPL